MKHIMSFEGIVDSLFGINVGDYIYIDGNKYKNEYNNIDIDEPQQVINICTDNHEVNNKDLMYFYIDGYLPFNFDQILAWGSTKEKAKIDLETKKYNI